MTIFWIMTALMAALAALLVLAGARRGVDAGEVVSPTTAAAELSELDRLKARGLLDEAGWTAARAEAGRRILAAGRDAAPLHAGPADRIWVLGGAGAAVACSLGLYAVIGRPGLPDQAWERRVDEWATQLDALQPPQIAAVVARVVEERPNDHQALTMLGAARFEAGDPLAAASAFRRAVALRPDDAQSWARRKATSASPPTSPLLARTRLSPSRAQLWASSGRRATARRKAEAAASGSPASKRAAPSMVRA